MIKSEYFENLKKINLFLFEQISSAENTLQNYKEKKKEKPMKDFLLKTINEIKQHKEVDVDFLKATLNKLRNANSSNNSK